MSEISIVTKTAILDRNEHIVGFLLKASRLNDTSYFFELNTLITTLFQYGLSTINSNIPLYIPLSTHSYVNDTLESIPRENTIILLECNYNINSIALKKIEEYHKLGYHFALLVCKEDIDEQQFGQILTYCDTILYQTQNISLQTLNNFQSNYAHLTHIALDIDSEATHEIFTKTVPYVSGNFYTKEITVSQNETLSQTYQDTLHLLNVLQKEEDIDSITIEFTKFPEITLKLLQHLNSPNFHLKKAIRSIRHALLLIGKKSLKKWLLMIAFNSSDSSEHEALSALLYSVETRVKLMNSLAKICKSIDHNQVEEAAFVAILSLLDRLLEISKSDLFTLIEVDDEIKEAVLEHRNTLGDLLNLTMAIESFNPNKIKNLINKLNIDESEFEREIYNSYFEPIKQ